MSRQQRRLLPTRIELLAAGFVAAASCVVLAVIKSSKAIREEIGELMDKVEAITAVAAEENRDLTDAEKAEIDGILGAGKKGEQGYKPGKIDQLEADLARVEKIEAKAAEFKTRRTETPPQRSDGPQGDDAQQTPVNRVARVQIPIQHQHRYGKLKSYKGEDAEKRAYIAGRFFLASLYADADSQKWCQEHGIDVRFMGAMREGSNNLGGFVVPVEVEQSIIDLREEYGVFRRESFVTSMAGDTKLQPRRKSGLTAYFVGENEEGTESEKQWDQVQLVAKKTMVLARFSSELSEDAIISMGDDLTGEIAYAFSDKEDACGFVGDGTSTYGKITGVVNALAAGSIVTAAAGNTAFETLDLADFEACVGKLPMYPGIRPKWYISQAGFAASMLRLLDAAGGNTAAMLAAGPTGLQFLGYPVVISQKLNSTLGADASKTKALFGDLRMGSTFGNRRGVSVMLSEHRYFELDQIGIKGTERFDIVVHGRGTATAPGPIVALKTPGA